MIVDHLEDFQSLETLASFAQVNHALYDLVVPKLYRTVEIKAYNQAAVAYGHSPSLDNSEFARNSGATISEADFRR